MFYVFLVGLAKLHCGATPPSVMVLLIFLLSLTNTESETSRHVYLHLAKAKALASITGSDESRVEAFGHVAPPHGKTLQEEDLGHSS